MICGNGHVYILDGISLQPKIMRKADMNEARSDFGLALSPCGNYVFAFGGCQMGNTLEYVLSVERYSIAEDVWHTVSYLNEAVKGMTVVTMPDGIYLIGGHKSLTMTYTERVLRFDP